jgi:hypothetical protein
MLLDFKYSNRFKDPEYIAKRAASVVIGEQSGFEIWFDSSGGSNKWQIDMNNNWWLRFENGVAILSWRYSPLSQTQQDALKTILEWVFRE